MSFGEVVGGELWDSSSSKVVLMGEKSSALTIETYYFLLDFCWEPFFDLASRNSSAPTRAQTTLNTWSHVQARRRQTRRGYQSVRYSYTDSTEQSTINNFEATETYNNGAKCYWSVPAPIDPNVTWRIIGGNVNGLIKPSGDMAALITVSERLRALQAETITSLAILQGKCSICTLNERINSLKKCNTCRK
jgi:hypothetical protein